MIIARFASEDIVRYGAVEGTNICGLKFSPFSQLGNSLDLDESTYKLDEVRLLAPCVPTKLICIGLNYRAHAEESGSQLPKTPLLFMKPPSAVIGPGDEIVLSTDGKTDHESELAVVIGQKAKGISETEAKHFILGYTCFNDVSERVMQHGDGQWTRGKGFDTFAPMGPWINTGIDGDDLKIEAMVNGEVKQSSRTSDLIFGISKLVSFISGVMTLFPGDIIATGTPSGVSPLKDGDIVEIRIEKIGTLRNYVVKRSN